MREITPEIINDFLIGKDPMERIISIECGYMEDKVSIIYKEENGRKRIKKEPFFPFVWAKQSVGRELFGGDRSLLIKKMKQYGIWSKGLTTANDKGETTDRLESGYRVMFFAREPMSYNRFMQFFTEGKQAIYNRGENSSNKDFLSISPVEQHMIRTGKRMFKGYEDYDELLRLVFDLETQGLDPSRFPIDQIGIRTNKGYEKVIPIDGEGEERKLNELNAIRQALQILAEIKPDLIAGHNSENFDWNYLIIRLEMLGSSMEEESAKFFSKPIYKKKKQAVLKLGGEIEYYFPTVIWGFNVTDSLHAVRRAQAIDSNMKKADLKYVTKYSKLNKMNRVYVQGDAIKHVWADSGYNYAHNDTNGDWYKISEKKPLKDGYVLRTGRYIVERYLLDDLYETDKVELRYNQSNFLLGKLLPTSFGRVCTMGTAGIWKLIMLAWSYENDLAVPSNSSSVSFTGGLSRLLSVGYVDRVVKLDYNSLYPAIILTWLITTGEDISGVMLKLLEYILTEREKFKELKSKAGKEAKKLKEKIKTFEGTDEDRIQLEEEIRKWESEESSNDKKQLPFKIFGNSFFGSFAATNIFNWGQISAAENTTCNGRQSLRLMIKWFTDRKYKPIVGDSFTGDTPLLIKYNETNIIDIKPISSLINVDEINVDLLKREYDYSSKPYKILCRSGWVEPTYFYRHKTNKDIYRVEDKEMIVDVTEDHSLYDSTKKEIKPSEIDSATKLEYFDFKKLEKDAVYLPISEKEIEIIALGLANNIITEVPINILNANVNDMEKFFSLFIKTNNGRKLNLKTKSKTCLAGLFYIKNVIERSYDKK